jgi:pimeloyl-ACP methyl ester carboxylesterase
MPRVKANNIEIEYDTFGDPSSKPLLLIMGRRAQMIRWEKEFCEKFVEKGFYVIRFDNRDVGLSTKFYEASEPDIMKVLMKAAKGERIESLYTLNDMADDAVGLLSALGIDKAHICGASMGGAIAQILAYRHPSRVLSLTSIMSSTGNPDLPRPKPEILKQLNRPTPTTREAIIEDRVNNFRILHGPFFPFDEKKWRELATASYERSHYPPGYSRQFVAIRATGNIKPALSSIRVPTLVIHGSEDPLVPVEGGKDTAEAIPGAELLIIEGMGHSIPIQVWPKIVDAITKNASKAY